MSTNYYWITKDTEGKTQELHIGKTSCGWYFALRIYPDIEINTLNDWKQSLKNGSVINEYGEDVEIADLLDCIENKHGGFIFNSALYEKRTHFHETSYSENGIRGLVRSRIGHGCVGHGEGPWSYFDCEFS